MKTPRYTDLHRYPHGYKPSNETNIKETFERVENEQKASAAERLRKCIAIKARAK